MPAPYKITVQDPGSNLAAVIQKIAKFAGQDTGQVQAAITTGQAITVDLEDQAAGQFLREAQQWGTGVVSIVPVDSGSPTSPVKTLTISGKVTVSEGSTAGIKVRAFDQAFRREVLLGESALGDLDSYLITYKQDQLINPAKGIANLVVRAYSPRGTLLGSSKTHDFSDKVNIDLKVTPAKEDPISTFETLNTKLRPILQTVRLADLTDEDIPLLQKEAQVETAQLEQLKASDQLALETGLPTPIFYAFAAQGQDLNLDTLVDKSKDDIKATLDKAVQQGMITSEYQDLIDSVVDRFKDLKIEKGTLLRHEFVIQLVREEAPLLGYTVRVAGSELWQSQTLTTDSKGQCVVEYAAPPGSTTTLQFQIGVFDRKNNQLLYETIRVKAGQTKLVLVEVPKPAPPSPTTTLEKLAADLGILLTADQKRDLKAAGIETLSAILEKGGFANLNNSKLPPENSSLKRLQAHAYLSLLTNNYDQDFRKIDKLYQKNYNTILDITEKTRAEFVSHVSDSGQTGANPSAPDFISDLTAATYYAVATAQSNYLNNLITAYRADKANGYATALNIPELDAALDQSCQCNDCESAVSPAAYLADLMKYALKHVKNGQNAIDLDFLETTFHQPFSQLPISCGAVEQKVRQVRICIEVLRKYLGNHPLGDAAKEKILKTAEKAYLRAAYTFLLTQLGTSYDEVRSLRNATPEEKRALSDRLNIDPGTDGIHIDRLFLNIEDDAQLTEQALEKFFGLLDTTGDFLLQGVKLKDPQSQIVSWSFEGIEWNHNTDEDGAVHLSLVQSGDASYKVQVYRASDRNEADLVAEGETNNSNGTANLVAKNNSGLYGAIAINYKADASDIEILAIPYLLSWQLQYLRTLWQEQDWTPGPYTVQPTGAFTTDDLLPVIDPDIIGPDDFRVPFVDDKDAPKHAFDLWVQRREWVDQKLQELWDLKGTDGAPDLDAMLKLMGLADEPTRNPGRVLPGTTPSTAPTVPPFARITVWQNITKATLNQFERNLRLDIDVEETEKQIWRKLKLTTESFRRLMEIKAFYDNKLPIEESDWDEVYSILVQAQKVNQYSTWQQQERTLEASLKAVLLSPRHFWIALQEPETNSPQWPPAYLLDKSLLPVIDPEKRQREALPAGRKGKYALLLWQSREARLKAIEFDLQSSRQRDKKLDEMMHAAFGTSSLPAFNEVKANLQSGDSDRRTEAENQIQDQLYMEIADFDRLVELEPKIGQIEPDKQLKPEEWEDIDRILISAAKASLKAQWVQEEKQLPWIDPDQITFKALPEPTADAKAIQLWQVRQNQLNDIHESLAEQRKKKPFDIDTLLWFALGKTSSPLPELEKVTLETLRADLRDEVKSYKAKYYITALLYMTVEDFSRFMAVRTKAQAPEPENKPTDADWEAVYTILTLAHKYKQLYSDWAKAEEPLAYWQKFKAKLPQWRASTESRQQWQQTLRDRSQLPHIDPDLIGAEYVRYSNASDSSFELWRERETQLQTWHDELKNLQGAASFERFQSMFLNTFWRNDISNFLVSNYALPQDAAEFDALLTSIFQTDELGKLLNEYLRAYQNSESQKADREKIRAFRDFYLTPSSFDHLLSTRMELQAGNSSPDAQKTQALKYMLESMLIKGFFNTGRTGSAGYSATAQLAQFGLSRSAFNQLLSAHNTLTQPQQLLDSEWEDIYNILVQVKKRRATADWRNEEQQKGITLSQDHFKFPEQLPFGFQVPEPEPLPTWRATWRDRRDWEDRLDTRIKQQQSVIDAMNSLVSKTEEAVLPQLRNALVMATDSPDSNGQDLAAKAKLATDRLLIDAAMSGCQCTTRISQAIETLQGLIWSIRTGLIQDTYPDLQLDADNFDEEWKWIGSYATWRSAMIVFLYPENVLLPTLRRFKTPAFQKLITYFRNMSAVTPEDAISAVEEYSVYFRDVCNLSLEATCWASARLAIQTSSEGESAKTLEELSERKWLFLFSRSKVSGKVYWSVYNHEDSSGFAQTFWETIPVKGLDNITKIIGATLLVHENESYILLSCIRGVSSEYSKQDVVLAKFNCLNVSNNQWQEEVTVLSLPPNLKDYSVAPIQSTRPITKEYGLPVLYFLSKIDNKLFRCHFNFGEDSEKDPYLFGEPIKIDAFLNYDVKILSASFVFSSLPSVFILYLCENYDNPNPLTIFRSLGGIYPAPNLSKPIAELANFDGSLILPDNQSLYAFTQNTFAKRKYTSILASSDAIRTEEIDESIFGDYFNSPWDFSKKFNIAPNSGHLEDIPVITGNNRFSRKRFDKEQGVFLSEISLEKRNSSKLVVQNTRRIAPKLPKFRSSENITTVGTTILPSNDESELARRKNIIRQAFLLTKEYGSDSVLTYLEEAFYFVPIFVAGELQKWGEYRASLDWFRTVYNYTKINQEPKIYYGLLQEETITGAYSRPENWLIDPINPHQIARQRANTYTRFTLLSLIQSLLSYADSEFTTDTIESNSRAKKLYTTALELLESLLRKQDSGTCKNIIGDLVIQVGEEIVQSSSKALAWLTIISKLSQFNSYETVKQAAEKLKATLRDNRNWEDRLREGRRVIEEALVSQVPSSSFSGTNGLSTKVVSSRAQTALLTQSAVVELAQSLSVSVSKDFTSSTSRLLNIQASTLQNTSNTMNLPWLRQSSIQLEASSLDTTETASQTDFVPLMVRNSQITAVATTQPIYQLNSQLIFAQDKYIPEASYNFCISPNPIVDALRLRAEINLFKLRNCLNIAGMPRELEPYAAPTDTTSGLPTIGAGGQIVLPGATNIQPTQYRYRVLLERAKQFTNIAQQMESTFLSILEKYDAESYNLLKARQDAGLARQGVRLRDLQVVEAEAGVKLAELQRDGANIRRNHYGGLLDKGPLDEEEWALGLTWGLMAFQFGVATARAAAIVVGGIAGDAATAAGKPVPATTFLALLGAAALDAQVQQGIASGISAWTSALSMQASFERRRQEWELQKALADNDVLAGTQQIVISEARVNTTEQERKIASMQADFTDEVVEFLNNKFTNAALYDWMSGILENVYRYFLQQATAISKLAENQLAFERQEPPAGYIQADYWQAPTEGAITTNSNETTPDRRGLTGSARLLQDLYRLDQYAFETETRKLQLTKTISLAQLDPYVFQQFRETGVMLFNTPMKIFDRDFPGHYLRLIKRVRTSVIALIPPIQGIQATLTTSGISRVVVGRDLFQTIPIRRQPESVALTSPQNATGLFELEPQSEMLYPFEGMGVDTSWELRLPKPSNLFDFNTIADVLLTIEYTSLSSPTYYQQVIQELDTSINAERPFSFRNQFSDAWYDLHNPDLSDRPMHVAFRTKRADFPPNLTNLKIDGITLYVSRKPTLDPEDATNSELRIALRFTPDSPNQELSTNNQPSTPLTVDNSAPVTIKGLIRYKWTTPVGKQPFGMWELALLDSPEIRDLFEKELIEDILFVISYSGHTPPWPK